MESNYFQCIFQYTWDLFSIDFTIYGFTISFAGIFIFSLLSSFAVRAIFHYLLD